ncbi:type IV secretion system protein [Rodentibacter caecimuris]|uniref:type IV secretion system protein n=1 Tax=Rodentibacter caecimuris TaxID=1796644 RepID=UPI002119E573|nr:type IV secretion system protein [Rodentibacter heylii]MCQ9124683.1 type IV secretion system protein [Rodentibacter heylii]
MKKTLKATLIAATVAISANYATASGIPTVDAAGIATTIAENLKTIAQLKEQLDALRSQIEQAKQFAKDTKNRLEGNWKLSDIINNDQFLNALPADARDILTDGMSILGLRKKYDLTTENVGLQKEFDRLIAYAERTEKNYNNTVKRLRNLKQIKVLNDAATTPAQKQDVANKLALLQLEFNQEQTALKQTEDQLKAQEKLEKDQQKQAWDKAISEGKKRFLSKYDK